MIVNTVYDPLTAAIPAEIPLPNAPLVRVIAQVRFPPVLSIEKRDFVASFQEAIRARYPILRAEQTQGLVVGPQGAAPLSPQIIWRFSDVEERWRVSLAPDFAAIETTAYRSRKDFFARFTSLVQALAEQVSPKIVDRIGIRYIDRVTGEAVRDLGQLVRPEVLGVAATAAAEYARYTLSESVFAVPELSAQLLARWGCCPKAVRSIPPPSSRPPSPVGFLTWICSAPSPEPLTPAKSSKPLNPMRSGSTRSSVGWYGRLLAAVWRARMSVHVIDNLRQPVAPLGTSGDGVLEWSATGLIRIGGTLALRDTTSSATSSRWAEHSTDAQQTNSGLVASPATGTPSAAIAELRRAAVSRGSNSRACLASPGAACISGRPAKRRTPRTRNGSADCWRSFGTLIEATLAPRGRP